MLQLSACASFSILGTQKKLKLKHVSEGVHMVFRWPGILMILESDCQSVVSKLQATGRDRSQLWQIRISWQSIEPFASDQDQ